MNIALWFLLSRMGAAATVAKPTCQASAEAVYSCTASASVI